MLDRDQLTRLYGRRAGRYDFTANLYYLIGFRERHYRRLAVRALALAPGDTVVEIGCGTGLNFPLLRAAVGEEGRIVGVDLTEAMLARARRRVVRNGWRNVELVRADAADYAFPDGVRGVLSTFALTLVPEHERVIARAARALVPGGRMVVLDLKAPEAWPRWAVRLGVWLTAPFGVTPDIADRRPWEAMARHLPGATRTDLYGGCAYVAVGRAPPTPVSASPPGPS